MATVTFAESARGAVRILDALEIVLPCRLVSLILHERVVAEAARAALGSLAHDGARRESRVEGDAALALLALPVALLAAKYRERDGVLKGVAIGVSSRHFDAIDLI